MFDDLRNDEKTGQFTSDDFDQMLEPASKKERKPVRLGGSGKILGMNAMQRFVLSLLLLFVTCLGGMMLLLLTGRVALF